MNGKKPLSQKPQQSKAIFSHDDVFGNQLGISAELRKELDDQGLDCRWINAQQLYDYQGYHPKGWVPYKRKVASGTMEFKYGNDPEGVIRRGTCILAVKKKEDVEKHRAYIKQRAQAQDVNRKMKSQADDLRKMARDAGVEMKIHEGYDEEK